ncbi:hypothetical protein GCM10010327_40460 [Streptomyces nitrosporeus]|nr:hypothetical protein GCM10010327_40460 [Streptomyces nitrosporeus]
MRSPTGRPVPLTGEPGSIRYQKSWMTRTEQSHVEGAVEAGKGRAGIRGSR